MSKPRTIVIVGGVAGGASCAARLRRLDEAAEILIFDRGDFVSFANCGLPYHVGDVIPEESSLILASPELFRARFRIDVKIRHEVVAIDRAARTVKVRNLATGAEFQQSYDALVLSPGATPLRPPLPGLDLPGVFTVRTIPDTRVIREWMESRQAKKAIVVGAGFIGLEMAENLRHRGLEVTVVEMAGQIMPPLDPEMVRPMENHLRKHGIELRLGDGLAAIESVESESRERLRVRTASGWNGDADLVISALGVRPDNALAKEAGLALGERGGIKVDARLRTSDPDIFAVGDAIEVTDWVLEQQTLLALAGPANRQGRMVADILAGRDVSFRGVQATSVCGVFDMAIASTGATEKALLRAGWSDFEKVYLHPKNHVNYYPGAEVIHLKILFQKSTGRLLGAQAVGMKDAPRKIDVCAALIQMGGTVYDLEEAELCYAPQYGAAKDAVNYAGMIASNVLRGDMPLRHWISGQLPDASEAVLLDVRDADEFADGSVPGAINIPLPELRDRLEELPRDREILIFCQVGQRGYYAVRILAAHGFQAANLSGGYLTYLAQNPA